MGAIWHKLMFGCFFIVLRVSCLVKRCYFKLFSPWIEHSKQKPTERCKRLRPVCSVESNPEIIYFKAVYTKSPITGLCNIFRCRLRGTLVKTGFVFCRDINNDMLTFSKLLNTTTLYLIWYTDYTYYFAFGATRLVREWITLLITTVT